VKQLIAVVLLAATLAGGASAAPAGSAPIGSLPPGPVSAIAAQRGELIAVALPVRDGGRVWRVARPFEARVLRPVSEANVGGSVVLVFRARGGGSTTIALALTRGDSASKALESRLYRAASDDPGGRLSGRSGGCRDRVRSRGERSFRLERRGVRPRERGGLARIAGGAGSRELLVHARADESLHTRLQPARLPGRTVALGACACRGPAFLHTTAVTR
jgi:hypothetical protein